MKVNNKIIITLGITCFFFLVLSYLGSKYLHHYYLFYSVILTIIFLLLIFWLFQMIFIKRLKKLDKELMDIISNKSITHRVPIEGKDELSSVSLKINYLLDLLQVSHEKLEQKIIGRLHELENVNQQLQQEITERRSLERKFATHKPSLGKLEHYDDLTTLPNSVYFNETLNKTIRIAKRYGRSLALLIIDFDAFKNVNDLLGVKDADLVIKEIGNRFAKVLRAGDTLARLGGDEFAVLLHDINHAKFAGTVAVKLLRACAHAVEIESHQLFITSSIGIAIFPNDGTSLEELVKSADTAMQKVKQSGGGSYQYFTQEMNLIAHEHVKLEEILRHATHKRELELYYQPELSLQEGIVVCAEALLRLKHKELGVISPKKFIPIAEELGLILPIGEWILHEACRTCKSWQNSGYEPVRVAVNISPKQFQLQDIAKIVASALRESDLDPEFLELEITESTFMQDVDLAISKLNNLSAMGVRISIDDFGTGYTSINYLKQFPLNVLKIDKSFIRDIPNNQNDLAITNAIIALSHNLGLEVVAEGVETAEQMEYLSNHNCDLIQGYFFSRPLPAHKVTQLFTKSLFTKNS